MNTSARGLRPRAATEQLAAVPEPDSTTIEHLHARLVERVAGEGILDVADHTVDAKQRLVATEGAA